MHILNYTKTKRKFLHPHVNDPYKPYLHHNMEVAISHVLHEVEMIKEELK